MDFEKLNFFYCTLSFVAYTAANRLCGPDGYCFGNVTKKQDVTFLNNVTEAAFVYDDEEEEEIIDNTILGYCLIVSVIFLIPTALIYTALPELRTIIEVFNSMQGLLIFLLLVVFRKRVIKVMYKHGWLDCISEFIEVHLALQDDEENVVQHTDVPMSMGNRNIVVV
ncbi:unnamed protein product [Arctia plantaginis]|uniref:Uncharacterized protein n=1 Tax=Arctia plantaginis TaxID=874455 RepID=A0A8S1ALA6_ARCPL|nr:unnamed protein product [Arctia plantaginis]